MAEAPRNPLPSGYDEDFVNAFEEDFQCLICHLAQKEPVQTRCGHRFCKECLEEHFRRQVGEPSTCPADWRTLNRDQDIFPDKATERKILSLIIRCPNDDCEWTGELRYKETHLASCPFRDVPCTNENCQVKLKWKDLFEHVTATCQWGIILCEHCSERHPKCQMEVHIREKCKLRPLSCPYKCGALNLRDKELQDHLETCQRFPVRCPNNCEAVIFREMVSNHIKDYCPLTKIPCPYAWMGCRTEVHRDQLESHIQCATKSHLDLACGELRDTHEKLKEKIIHFDRLEERVNILHEQLEEKVNDIQHQHQNNVDFLQRQHQLRVGVLQEQLEQNVKTCHMERKIFLVCLVLGLVFITFYLTKLDRVQKNVEEQLSVIQSLYERNVHIVKKDLEDRFQKELEEKVTVIKNLEDRFQTKLEEKVSVIQSLHERNVRMVKKDLEDRFQKELEEKVTVMKNLEDRVQTKLEEKVSVIQSLHEKNVILEVDPEVSHTFIWKITNYEDKLRQVKNNGKRKIESVPFYANGYNLMLRLWPNGYDVGTNTHLSISIVVMKGEYDAILPWGFSKQVTFTLMDQQDNPNQRQNVVMAFTADPNDEVFTKPVEGETRSGSGFPEFVSHNHLRTRRFIVDDTLFIKFQVDSPKAKTSWL